MIYPLKMVMFHSYVSLPEGTQYAGDYHHPWWEILSTYQPTNTEDDRGFWTLDPLQNQLVYNIQVHAKTAKTFSETSAVQSAQNIIETRKSYITYIGFGPIGCRKS